MSDRETRENGGEAELEQSLRARLRALKEKKRPCPDADLLRKFHAKSLSADESRAIEEHVALCGLCDLKLGRLAEADPSADPPGAVPPSVWEQVDPRFTRRFEEFLASAKRPPRRPVFVFFAKIFATPAPAYVLALLLCYPAYLGLTNRVPGGSPPPSPVGNSPARVADCPQAPGW